MSHYFCVIISEKRINEEQVAAIMEPYSDWLKVPPYFDKCYCVGEKAKSGIRKKADELFGSYDSMRKKFSKDIGWYNSRTMPENVLEKEWNKRTKDKNSWIEKEIENHPEIGHKDPNCTECNDQGLYETTRNPNAKWDWYEIGGSWDMEVSLGRKESEVSRPYTSSVESYFDNRCLIEDNTNLVRKYRSKIKKKDATIPFAIITPDGVWHERGKMLMFGLARDIKNDWDATVFGILEKYKDHYIIGIDCHI